MIDAKSLRWRDDTYSLILEIGEFSILVERPSSIWLEYALSADGVSIPMIEIRVDWSVMRGSELTHVSEADHTRAIGPQATNDMLPAFINQAIDEAKADAVRFIESKLSAHELMDALAENG